jgi:hypothetical protein
LRPATIVVGLNDSGNGAAARRRGAGPAGLAATLTAEPQDGSGLAG